MNPQNRKNEHIFDRQFRFLGSFINLWSWKYTQKLAFYFRSKTMPNTLQTTAKKLRKNPQNDFFDPPKWPNLGCQFGKNCRFFGPLSTFELYFWLVGTENVTSSLVHAWCTVSSVFLSLVIKKTITKSDSHFLSHFWWFFFITIFFGDKKSNLLFFSLVMFFFLYP